MKKFEKIAREYTDSYTHGRGWMFQTPRRRMMESIKRKEKKAAEKKAGRLTIRQQKMAAWAEQREYEREQVERINLIESSTSARLQQQESENNKSVLLFAAVFGIGCLLLSLLVYAAG